MTVDIVVVGGGIIGCTAAWYLAKNGLSVSLVEKREIGAGTTARNFSWINATTKTSDTAYHRLNAMGVQMYTALAQEFGAANLGLGGAGAIGTVRRSDMGAYSAMQDQAQALEELGYPCKRLGLVELQALEPNMLFANDAEGLLTPTDKSLDAPKFTRFMADQLRENGGQMLENCIALEIDADDEGNVRGLKTNQGLIKTPRILLAAGPDTPEVLGKLTGYDGFATRFPVKKVPGFLVSTPMVKEGLLRHLIYTDSGGEFHVFPEQNGGLRLASDEIDGQLLKDCSPGHLRTLATSLLQRMQDLLPGFAGAGCLDDCSLSVGIRAYPEDGKSIAGALPGAEGIFVIATHSGITLAPALGSLMADLIAEGEVPVALKSFELERLPGFERTD